MRMMKIKQTYVNFVQTAMTKWKTSLYVNNNPLGDVKISTGIYQGDCLSPLLFIMALIPLSWLLNSTKCGIQLNKNGRRINHLLYMDDLKLFAKNDHEITKLLDIVEQFSGDIGMKFGLKKCASAAIDKGKLIENGEQNRKAGLIQDVEKYGPYKYLGLKEKFGILEKENKVEIKEEYHRRIKTVLRTKLNAKNIIMAINMWAIPVILYTAGVLKWSQSELNEIDSNTRKQLTVSKVIGKKQDIDRLYLPRRIGGKGLLKVKDAITTQDSKQRKYEEEMKDVDSIIAETQKYQQTLQEDKEERTKKDLVKERRQKLENKPLHGQWFREITPKIDTELTYRWLTWGGVTKQIENTIMSGQEQATRLNYIRKMIDKQEVNPNCRKCKTKPETIEHVVSGCSKLASLEYTNRHNDVARLLHWHLCRKYGLPATPNPNHHKIETKVIQNENVKITWDLSIRTDQCISANRPDIVIWKDCEIILIDVAIPSDYNIVAKQSEKVQKYIPLAKELKRIYKRPVIIVPLVIGALGAIPKLMQKVMTELSIETTTVYKMQKVVLQHSAAIIWDFLQEDESGEWL
jgi:hypothetical protein